MMRGDGADEEDHPRVCGENGSFLTRLSPMPGSPPRVRGKHGECDTSRRFRRITPACAGKTNIDSDLALAAKDHPRVCGEN